MIYHLKNFLASLGLWNSFAMSCLLGFATLMVFVVFVSLTSLLSLAALGRRIGRQEIPYRAGGIPPIRR
jgi:hypothetical protein